VISDLSLLPAFTVRHPGGLFVTAGTSVILLIRVHRVRAGHIAVSRPLDGPSAKRPQPFHILAKVRGNVAIGPTRPPLVWPPASATWGTPA
jgi:hypothetical protein